MKKITVLAGQTLVDIAIRRYGCYEGIFILCADNGLSVTSIITPGQELWIRVQVPELTDDNRRVVAYYDTNGIEVNSGYYEPEDGDYVDDEYVDDEYVI